MHLDDAGELRELDPYGRVDVGFADAATDRQGGELAGGIPVERPLPGEGAGQFAEHGQVGEWVVAEISRIGNAVSHGASLRRRIASEGVLRV